MGEIADLVKQKESQGESIADLVKQKEMTHEGSFAAVTPDQKLAATYGELGEPGLPDTGLRADLSLSKDFGDKMAKFADAYPYGELKHDKETDTTLFRKTPAEPWAKLDAGMFEKLELGDISDLAGDIPAIAGEILMTKGSGSLMALAGKAFLGAAGGDIARSLSEKGRGFEAPNWGKSAALEGALGAGGEVAGGVVRGGVNALRGAGAIQPDPFIKKTMREADRFGAPQLHPGQASENPVMQAFSRQSRALSGKIHQYERTQEGHALSLLEGLRDRGEILSLPKTLETAVKRRENEITRRIVHTPSDQTATGKNLFEGIEEYRDMSGRVVSHSYDEARAVAEPGFDVSDVFSKADELESGVRALLKGTETTVPSSITDEFGNPLGDFVVKEAGKTKRVSEVPGELLKVIEELKQLDPAALADANIAREAGADAPFDVLKDLRTRLFDLKTPADGVFRNEHRLASELYTSLTNAMKNPQGGGADFMEKWAKATGLAADRFNTLEQPFIAKALRSHDAGDVEALYRSLFRPNNANQVEFVGRILKGDKWEGFRMGAVSDLTSKPYKMWDRLNEFDDATLKQVFSTPEVDGLKNMAFQFKRLEQTGIKAANLRQANANAVVSDIVKNMNTGGSDTLFEMAGGRNTSMGRKIRAGLIEWIRKDATERTKVGKQVNRQAIMTSVNTLKENGMLKFLTTEDKRLLHSFLPDYLSLIRGIKTDAGESMRRGAIIQKLTDKTWEGIADILEEVMVGRIMTTAGGQKWIYGFRGKPWNLATMRRVTAGLAILADDYEKEQ